MGAGAKLGIGERTAIDRLGEGIGGLELVLDGDGVVVAGAIEDVEGDAAQGGRAAVGELAGFQRLDVEVVGAIVGGPPKEGLVDGIDQRLGIGFRIESFLASSEVAKASMIASRLPPALSRRVAQ